MEHSSPVDLVRKPDHAVMNIVVPVYILAVLATCSFLIPANEGERIGYIITIHLAIVFIMSMVEEQAAPSGDFPRPKLFGMINFVNGLSLFSFLEVRKTQTG